jgi:hypothetical protein
MAGISGIGNASPYRRKQQTGGGKPGKDPSGRAEVEKMLDKIKAKEAAGIIPRGTSAEIQKKLDSGDIKGAKQMCENFLSNPAYQADPPKEDPKGGGVPRT